jgi:hypothetical protein
MQKSSQPSRAVSVSIKTVHIATRVLRRFRINQLRLQEISFLCMVTELRLGDMENEPGLQWKVAPHASQPRGLTWTARKKV